MKKYELPLKFTVIIIIIFIIGSGIYYCNNVTIDQIKVIDNKKTNKQIIVDKNLSLININTADKETLSLLPGIGEVLSERIISYREDNGSFKSIDDIKNVKGIGEKIFEKIKKKIII